MASPGHGFGQNYYIKGATLKVIPGAPHSMCLTLKNKINAQLLAFFQGVAAAAA
jgi:hypothetical protein